MPVAPRRHSPPRLNKPRDESRWASRKAEYRSWYSLPVWRKLAALVRAEEPLCRECLKRNEMTPTQCVDHIVPHRGDWERFADRENLQGLCKPCHAKKTAMEDGGFGNKKAETGKMG